MANILYLVHRLPYPPDKGDKVRSFNLLKYLLLSHRVFLGTFVDDSEDRVHVPSLTQMCAGVYVEEIRKPIATARSLLGLFSNESLTVGYYASEAMRRWVDSTYRDVDIDATIVFSSAMAQFVPPSRHASMLVDFVDVDSMKWRQYAEARNWPISWIFKRESKLLLKFEKNISERALRSFFVTDNEVSIFRGLISDSRIGIDSLMNGVDHAYFSPDEDRTNPYPKTIEEEQHIVFTGAMDYWPNVDAVIWFSKEILPALLKYNSLIKFYIVGRNPSASVLALANASVVVTGTVLDVRPYLQFATVIVAPLRVARGIQNKILEAMSMAKPVVASDHCASVIGALDGKEILSAKDEPDFIKKIIEILDLPERASFIGLAARKKVIRDFSWQAHLSKLDKYLPVAASI